MICELSRLELEAVRWRAFRAAQQRNPRPTCFGHDTRVFGCASRGPNAKDTEPVTSLYEPVTSLYDRVMSLSEGDPQLQAETALKPILDVTLL